MNVHHRRAANDNRANPLAPMSAKRRAFALRWLGYADKMLKDASHNGRQIFWFLVLWSGCWLFGVTITPSLVLAWLCVGWLLSVGLAAIMTRMAVDCYSGKFTPSELRR